MTGNGRINDNRDYAFLNRTNSADYGFHALFISG